MRKYLAEMVGTMVLVLMGCGSAVFAGNAADALGCLGFWLVGGRYGLYHRKCFWMPYQSGYNVGGVDVWAHEQP